MARRYYSVCRKSIYIDKTTHTIFEEMEPDKEYGSLGEMLRDAAEYADAHPGITCCDYPWKNDSETVLLLWEETDDWYMSHDYRMEELG